MRVHKASLALAGIAMLAAISADTASATDEPADGGSDKPTGKPLLSTELSRAPQPNQNLPSATSRPSNRDMRMAPSMGGRGMRSGRMNGAMGGRR